MGRTVIIGDVHGCREELEDLLDRVAFCASDRLVFVGDLVVRGPDSQGVVKMARQLRAESVRGNHEDRVLRWTSQRKPSLPKSIGKATREALESLTPLDLNYLAQLPYHLDLVEHRVRVVHAGIIPGIPIEQQNPRVLMHIRGLDDEGAPVEERGQRLWGRLYPKTEGASAPHIVFGHNARRHTQIHPMATGLDTGAVYGGRLTAMVLGARQEPPPESDRTGVLVSVPARRTYVEPLPGS